MPPQNSTLPGDIVWLTASSLSPYVSVVKTGVEVAKWFLSLSATDPVEKAFKELWNAVAQLAAEIERLEQRVEEMEVRQAASENLARSRRLADITNEILDTAGELKIAVTSAEKEHLADKAMRRANTFLEDVDLWNFTDVKTTYSHDGFGKRLPNPDVAIQPPAFKAFPALSVYALAVITWLVAVDASDLDLPSMRAHFSKELERHRVAVTAENANKPEFWLYDQIQGRLEVSIEASWSWARDHVCEYSIVYRNHMDHTSRLLRTYDERTEGRSDSCQANPGAAFGDHQQVLAEDPGLLILKALDTMLNRIASGGSLGVSEPGSFGKSSDSTITTIYARTSENRVHWWQQYLPNGVPDWIGPKTVDNWGEYPQVHSGGGHVFYGFLPDGLSLHWWKHSGVVEGAPLWQGPKMLRLPGNEHEWLDNRVLVPGGDGILYSVVLRHHSVDREGSLQWIRHSGFRNGVGGFGPETKVASDWARYRIVFSTGFGILYGVAADGSLIWNKHIGYLDGSSEWRPSVIIGQGFDKYASMWGCDSAFFYGMLPDGKCHVYHHPGWEVGDADLKGPIEAGDWSEYVSITPSIIGSPFNIVK